MTEEGIFIDSTAFLRFLIEGDIELANLKGSKLFTSTNVIEEITYVLLKTENWGEIPNRETL